MFWIYSGNRSCVVGNKWCHRLNPVSSTRCHRLSFVIWKLCSSRTALSRPLQRGAKLALFQTLYFDFCVFWLTFLFFLGSPVPVTLIVIFPLYSKRFYVSCFGFYIIFFAWNLLLFSVDITHWNWKYTFHFLVYALVCFGLGMREWLIQEDPRRQKF